MVDWLITASARTHFLFFSRADFDTWSIWDCCCKVFTIREKYPNFVWPSGLLGWLTLLCCKLSRLTWVCKRPKMSICIIYTAYWRELHCHTMKVKRFFFTLKGEKIYSCIRSWDPTYEEETNKESISLISYRTGSRNSTVSTVTITSSQWTGNLKHDSWRYVQ